MAGQGKTCPHCGSSKVARSRRRGAAEQLGSLLLGRLPFRCRECKTRFILGQKTPWGLVALGLVVLLAGGLVGWWLLGGGAGPESARLAEMPLPQDETLSGEGDQAGMDNLPQEARPLLEALRSAGAPEKPPLPSPPPPVKTAPPPPPGKVVVPQLKGAHRDYAKAELEDLGLVYKGALRGPAPGRPHLQIFAQEPPGGTVVPEGSEVVIKSWQAPPEERRRPWAVMPPVTDLRREAARESLARLGLKPRTQRIGITDPAWNGVVASQEPAAGTELEPGSEVSFTYYDQGALAEAPLLEGLGLDFAVWATRKQGLEPRVTLHGPAPGKPHRQVFAQSPAPGALAPQGSEVHIKAYMAPEDEQAPRPALIPDGVGMYYTTAEWAIRRAGFKVAFAIRRTANDQLWGLITRQEPSAGVLMDQGETVRLFVATPNRNPRARGTILPLLVGHPVSFARWQLKRYGLGLEERAHPLPRGATPGMVFRQHPAPQTVVDKDALIKVDYYRPPDDWEIKARLTVPDLRGLYAWQAEKAARKAGLEARVTKIDYADRRESGLVVEQDPAPGAELAPGGMVEVKVAKPQGDDLLRELIEREQ